MELGETEELVRRIVEKGDLRHPGWYTGKTIGARGDSPWATKYGECGEEDIPPPRPSVLRFFTSLVLHSKYCSRLTLVLALK